jgi:polysaccharide chain length determinant protein (PEP-CTERM system associated)
MQIRKSTTSQPAPALATLAGVVRRRWWLVAVPAILGALIAYGFSRLIPNRYTSQTLVLVDHQKVPDSFVKPVINEDLNQRLSTMQEQILSRTRLQGLIESFGMFQKERGKGVAMEDLVAMLRKQISVAPVRGEYSIRTGGLPGFTISVTAGDPQLAQKLCSEVTSIFMSENLRLRGELAQSTTDFLKSQLENAKRDLDQQDSRLADFKRKYIGQLPGTEQTNMNMVASLTAQLETANQALAKVQQDKAYFDSLLADHLATLRQSHVPGAPATSPSALQQQLTVLNQQLATLQGRYTENFPDVIKTKQQIAQIQKQLESLPPETVSAPDTAPTTSEPAEIRQLRAQIRQLDAMAADRTQQQQRIQRDLSEYQGRLRLSPMVEEEFKKLTRDYQTALGFYNDLLTKYSQSEMATNLERRQEGEQFRVMDPPSLPEKPAYPNRPLFAGGGLALGLFLGMGLTYLLEASDDTIRGEREVELRLELPVLILLPDVRPAPRPTDRMTVARTGRVQERVSHV